MGRINKHYSESEVQVLLKTEAGRKVFIEAIIREEGKLKGWSTKRWIKEAKKFKRQCADFIKHGELQSLKEIKKYESAQKNKLS